MSSNHNKSLVIMPFIENNLSENDARVTLQQLTPQDQTQTQEMNFFKKSLIYCYLFCCKCKKKNSCDQNQQIDYEPQNYLSDIEKVPPISSQFQIKNQNINKYNKNTSKKLPQLTPKHISIRSSIEYNGGLSDRTLDPECASSNNLLRVSNTSQIQTSNFNQFQKLNQNQNQLALLNANIFSQQKHQNTQIILQKATQENQLQDMNQNNSLISMSDPEAITTVDKRIDISSSNNDNDFIAVTPQKHLQTLNENAQQKQIKFYSKQNSQIFKEAPCGVIKDVSPQSQQKRQSIAHVESEKNINQTQKMWNDKYSDENLQQQPYIQKSQQQIQKSQNRQNQEDKEDEEEEEEDDLQEVIKQIQMETLKQQQQQQQQSINQNLESTSTSDGSNLNLNLNQKSKSKSNIKAEENNSQIQNQIQQDLPNHEQISNNVNESSSSSMSIIEDDNYNDNSIEPIAETDSEQESEKGSGEGDDCSIGSSCEMESQYIDVQLKLQKGDLIGVGPHGKVHQCLNLETGELLAVKTIESYKEIINEKDLLFYNTHVLGVKLPIKGTGGCNICTTYKSTSRDSNENDLQIVSEFISGGSIKSLLKAYGSFEEQVVKLFVKQILNGLAYLHKQGIPHRNIKSTNILVESDGIIKLSDAFLFGLGGVQLQKMYLGDNNTQPTKIDNPQADDFEFDSSVASNDIIYGNIMFAAPEVLKDQIHSNQSDIWSLGCVTLEMLTGSPPYSNLLRENTMQQMIKLITVDRILPTIPETLSEHCKQFLQNIFQFDPAERPSVQQLLESAFIESTQENNLNLKRANSNQTSKSTSSYCKSVISNIVQSAKLQCVHHQDSSQSKSNVLHKKGNVHANFNQLNKNEKNIIMNMTLSLQILPRTSSHSPMKKKNKKKKEKRGTKSSRISQTDEVENSSQQQIMDMIGREMPKNFLVLKTQQSLHQLPSRVTTPTIQLQQIMEDKNREMREEMERQIMEAILKGDNDKDDEDDIDPDCL